MSWKTEYKILKDYFDKEYPGWEKQSDASKIRKTLKRTAKNNAKNQQLQRNS